jgi:signal transduction histidine kinase
VCIALKIKERPIGVLCAINDETLTLHRAATRIAADRLGSFAAAAVENARLGEEHRYVLLASERDRIAREMHDGIAQSLFSISLGLEVCKKQALRGDPRTSPSGSTGCKTSSTPAWRSCVA